MTTSDDAAMPREPSTREALEDTIGEFALSALEAINTVFERTPEVVVNAVHNLEEHIATARVVGQVTIAVGRKEAEECVRRTLDRATHFGLPLTNSLRHLCSDTETTATIDLIGVSDTPTADSPASVDDLTVTTSAAPVDDGFLEIDGVIQGYDSLTASNVLRLLDGLDIRELRTVADYERTGRRRTTILRRVDELLGHI